MAELKTGTVYLVGAGPGDVGLMTVRALELIARADVILYDRLIPDGALDGAREHAELVYVGKEPGGSVQQRDIGAELVARAQRGQTVVRLKGGDPFVFGRGGEEALALAAAGLAFEVVPGVSSALAAPALAGVPVTHRGLSSALLVVSGHADAAWRPALSTLAPLSATVVVLMGLATRAAVATLLVEQGWPRDTPAAVLWAASTARAARWRGPLAGLGAAEVPKGCEDAPATLVIGRVVALAGVLAPSEESDEEAAVTHTGVSPTRRKS